LNKKQKTDDPPKIEWGSKGTEPTMWQDYDWICAASAEYRPEK